MNIAILNFHRIGGSGIIAFEIAQALARRGHEIHFVGLKPPLRYNNQNTKMTFHPISMQLYPVFDFQPYTLALASQLSELVKKCNLQVIHSHYAIPHAVAAILARDIVGKKINCITTLHGTDITIVGSHPSMYNVTKYSIVESNHVTAVSDYLNQKTCENFNLPQKKIKTIYNFINKDSFIYNFVPPVLSQNKILLLHASNLRQIKAPLELIEIFSKLVKSNLQANFHLGIIGDGPYKNQMVKLAEKLGLKSKITFYGEKNNLSDIYQQANFFLLPSYDESFGLTALEAMSYGVIVFARQVGGIPEVITHGKDGFLFCYNHDPIISKINELITDEKTYRNISINAYQKVKGKFAHEKIIDQYEKLYVDF